MVNKDYLGRPTKALFGGFWLVKICQETWPQMIRPSVKKWQVLIGPNVLSLDHNYNQWMKSKLKPIKGGFRLPQETRANQYTQAKIREKRQKERGKK